MTDKNYYEILGVSEDATTDEIRKAFQAKARTLHPDVNKAPDAEEKFKAISEAYAVLSDDDKRKRYDAMRSGVPYGYPGWSTTSAGRPSGDPYTWSGFPFSDFSSYGYGQSVRSRAYNPRKGDDIFVEVTLDADQQTNGATRSVGYRHYVVCDACAGVGSTQTHEAERCPMCSGTGRMTLDLNDLIGFGVFSFPCPECDGSGKVVVDPCESCGGSGRVLTHSNIDIEIEANLHDGDMVRMSGKGNAGTNGREAGDLICQISVPSEKLSASSASGFSLLGFTMPLLLFFGYMSRWSLSTFVIFSLPIVMAVMSIVRGGLSSRSSGWWRNATRSFLGGLQRSLYFVLFAFAFARCGSQSMTRSIRG